MPRATAISTIEETPPTPPQATRGRSRPRWVLPAGVVACVAVAALSAAIAPRFPGSSLAPARRAAIGGRRASSSETRAGEDPASPASPPGRGNASGSGVEVSPAATPALSPTTVPATPVPTTAHLPPLPHSPGFALGNRD